MKAGLILLGLAAFSPRPAAAAHPAEDEAVKIIDFFYDYQFEKAVEAARALQRRYPGYPAGLFYESVAYYQRYLLEDPRQKETFAAFLKFNQAALALAVDLLPSDPAVSHYYQGAAFGFQARAYVAQKKYSTAIPNARHGAAHLKKALELDPQWEDANFGLGMYYYFLARVPAAAKPFAYLMVGMKGDRRKGLELLHRTVDKGQVAKVEAKSVLAAIYSSEKEKSWEESQHLLRELMERYPHNPRYHLSLIYTLERQGKWAEALALADSQEAWLAEVDDSVRPRAHALVCYRAAENLLFAGRYAEAAPLLETLESGPDMHGLKDWARLRRGNYWSALGQPDKAKDCYRSIRDKKARGLADKFIETPFPAGPRDVMPNRWPYSNVPIG